LPITQRAEWRCCPDGNRGILRAEIGNKIVLWDKEVNDMMFGGGMFLVSLLVLAVIAVPVVILIVAAGGGLALFSNRQVTVQPGGPGPHTPAFSSKRCPSCGQPLQADWRVCPYDGTEVG
jgi:hypothetical protein